MTNTLKPSAMFVLKTYDLPGTPGSNTIGTLNNAQRSSMTWQNVDLKTIMGTMWEKYDYFTITLVSVGVSQMSALVTNILDRSAVINLQGLQFINSSYSISSKCNIPIVQMGTVNMTVISTGSFSQNNFLAGVMFQKGKPILDLTITLNIISDGTILIATGTNNNVDAVNILPQQFYQFRIDGIEYKH